MQQASFLRVTAESSSVLDGEETRCLEAATPNPITQPYVAIALRPIQHPLRRLPPRRVQKTPNHVSTIIMTLISDDFNQDGLNKSTRPSSVDDPHFSFVPLIQLPIPARPELPVEGNIECLSIRYVSFSRCSTFTIQQCRAAEYLS